MIRKIILFFIICTLVVSGFAQKNKKNYIAKSPKSNYFTMLINGDAIPAEKYCPLDSILFSFDTLNTNIKDLTYCWNIEYIGKLCDTTPLYVKFPHYEPWKAPFDYTATIDFTFTLNLDTIRDTITNVIHIDYIWLDTTVCQGRDITVPTYKGDITFTNVQQDEYTLRDTLGCELVYWHIHMDPYITLSDSVSSCDSVVWGDIIVRRPENQIGDYTVPVERLFPSFSTCDTLRILTVTIIDTANLEIIFDQDAFCSGNDMQGTIKLTTNFTAFDWKYYSRENLVEPDSTWIGLTERNLPITEPGYYHVYAYMDTSLYETLTDLRIVATTCAKNADITVADCPLVIPNVFTPNGDGSNQYFGIKKLNLKRENELTIHDRWGKEVFRQKNYQCVYKNNKFENTENAFEGYSRGGQKLPEGTYYYAFKYDAFPRSKAKTYVGVVTIIR